MRIPLFCIAFLIYLQSLSPAHAGWDMIHTSLDVIPNPSLVRPVPLVGDTDNVTREITIPKGDIVGLQFTISNQGDQESRPMVVATHPLAMPLVIVVVQPDGSERLVPQLDPRRRRLPPREQPMPSKESHEASFFIYYAMEHARRDHQVFGYAFPQEGRYEIYVMYDAASTWQKAQAMRNGAPREHLYLGVDGWQMLVDARKDIPIPPILTTNRVIVHVKAPFDGWRELEAVGLELIPTQEPWHKQVTDDERRAFIEQLVTRANRPWLTQWWNGITNTWRPKATNAPSSAQNDPVAAGEHYKQIIEQLKEEGYDPDSLREQAPEAWQEYHRLDDELTTRYFIEGTLTAQDYYEQKAALADRYVRAHLRPMSQEELAAARAKRAEEQRQRQEAFQKRTETMDPRERAEQSWLMWKLMQLGNPPLEAIEDPEARRRTELERQRDLEEWLGQLPPEVARITHHLLSQENPQVSDRIRTAWEEAVQARNQNE
jgi:hypothetical protein